MRQKAVFMVNGKGKQIAHLENIFLWGFGISVGGVEGWQGQGLRVAPPLRAIFFPDISRDAFFWFEPGIGSGFSRLATPTTLFPGRERKTKNNNNKKRRFIDPTAWQTPGLPFSAKFQVKKISLFRHLILFFFY